MADKYSNLTQDYLKQLYDYNPDTGELWSLLYNRPVGFDHKGYRVVNIQIDGLKKKIYIHKIIWKMVHGDWPSQYIDHINGNKSDNRLCNLREVTVKQNHENKTIYKTKSGLPRSGYKGVHWNKESRKWIASIGHNKKTIYLGTYVDAQKAYLAYVDAAKKYHTHNETIKDESFFSPQQLYWMGPFFDRGSIS